MLAPRALDALAVVFDTECCVLAWDKVEFASAADAEHPQVGSEVDTPGDLRVEKLFVWNRHHLSLPSNFLSKLSRAVQGTGLVTISE